ncbi:MAG: glutamine amidotransferase [Nitrososphaerota archaeon]
MSDEWHEEMKEKFKQYGEILGFKAYTEVKIPRGKIDCMWELKEPVSEYFVCFEFETATAGSQIVENLVKTLSLAPQMKPRFLVQVYRDELKGEYREYIEAISRTLPIAVKVITGAGNDVEKASSAIIIELFNWIGQYADISKEFIMRLEKIVPRRNIIKIFHYGELHRGHLEYLDSALRRLERYLLWIKSIPTEKDKNKVPSEFRSLLEYDVVILSDVSIKYCDVDLLRSFLEYEVKQRGKSMILTGGYGLTKEYNLELGREYLGGEVGERFQGVVVKIAKSKDDIGLGLAFKGFNHFRPTNPEEVVAYWDKDDSPALIVHKVGNGKVIIFTSDCSPAWGTPSIGTEEFKEMWRQIMEKYCISG